MAAKKPKGDDALVRTARVEVWLTRAEHQRAHAACHAMALLWNALVLWVRSEWKEGRDPSRNEMATWCSHQPRPVPVHAHTVREVGRDLRAAVETYRENRAAGRTGRAPWREKKYRPLSFTANYGWRIHKNRLYLSFGSKQPRISLHVPEFIDPDSGRSVPPERWGEIQLCWDIDARVWRLHIAYTASDFAGIPQAKPGDANALVVAVDEGVINPMAAMVRADDGHVEALVINGRQIRDIKRYRNKRVGSIQSALAKCKNGSRKHRRLTAVKKKVQAKTDQRLHDADHQTTAKVNKWIRTQATNTATGEIRPVRLVVGDVRGVESKTNQQRRANPSQRQQLSQWSRGRQEDFLAYKTGLKIEHVPEHYTSQTCPVCGHRRKPTGRVYKCTNRACSWVGNRDVVGAVNIWSRATHGGTILVPDESSMGFDVTKVAPCLTASTNVVVTYRRAQPGWTPVQSALHGYHQHALERAVDGANRAGKRAVEASNRARARAAAIGGLSCHVAGKRSAISQPQPTSVGRGGGASGPVAA